MTNLSDCCVILNTGTASRLQYLIICPDPITQSAIEWSHSVSPLFQCSNMKGHQLPTILLKGRILIIAFSSGSPVFLFAMQGFINKVKSQWNTFMLSGLIRSRERSASVCTHYQVLLGPIKLFAFSFTLIFSGSTFDLYARVRVRKYTGWWKIIVYFVVLFKMN